MPKLIEENWNVNLLENWVGSVGLGFRADLLYKGLKVALVEEQGTGSVTRIFWDDAEVAHLANEIEASQPTVDADPTNPGKYTVAWSFSNMVYKLVSEKLDNGHNRTENIEST